MRTGKKIVHLILAFFMLILSLGTATGCLFDPEINVKRDGDNAYIYNGERYVYTTEMDKYRYIGIDSGRQEIGYAYTGIGLKVPVEVSNRDLEENVISLMTDYHYPSFCHPFYVRESASFPTNPWYAKYSSIVWVMDKEIEISFQLKNVLAKSPSYKDLSEMSWKMIFCILKNFPPVCVQLSAYLDSQNMYITIDEEDTDACYKVIDEEFKAAVMELCF